MPNHCYQQVRIEGPHKLVRVLWDGLTENGVTENGYVKNPQFNQLIIPMPFEIWNGAEIDWYEWRNENWNTKWDICDPRITDQSWDEETPYWLLQDKTDELEFTFTCWTAWAPPTPVWEDIQQSGVSVTAEYIDEGGFFQGTFADGETNEWEPKEEACH